MRIFILTVMLILIGCETTSNKINISKKHQFNIVQYLKNSKFDKIEIYFYWTLSHHSKIKQRFLDGNQDRIKYSEMNHLYIKQIQSSIKFIKKMAYFDSYMKLIPDIEFHFFKNGKEMIRLNYWEYDKEVDLFSISYNKNDYYFEGTRHRFKKIIHSYYDRVLTNDNMKRFNIKI